MVLQTGDLVTIDQVDPSIAPKIPELLRLREAGTYTGPGFSST